MSTVRLCDRCNTIFPRTRRVDYGEWVASGQEFPREMITETIALDYCPACSEDVMGIIRRR